jgi:hypothetical protein
LQSEKYTSIFSNYEVFKVLSREVKDDTVIIVAEV